ncbi:MAG: hypothetical protein K2X93_23385 [Candidatus Obscuribacterales bacterium]|nr:hypothetical protein [Candidatus Obscuribacterales bacterium]
MQVQIQVPFKATSHLSMTIDKAMSDYLNHVQKCYDWDVYEMTCSILKTYRSHLDSHGPETLMFREAQYFEVKGQAFCTTLPAYRAIDLLERFFRYCLYREIYCRDFMRSCFHQIMHRFFRYLYDFDWLDCSEYRMVEDVITRVGQMESQAKTILFALKERIGDERDGTSAVVSATYPKYVVSNTLADAIWLKPLEAKSTSRNLGPIRIGRDLVDKLTIGWLFECEVRTIDGRQRFIAVNNILPSLGAV